MPLVLPVAGHTMDFCEDVFAEQARDLGAPFTDPDVEQQIQKFLENEHNIVGRASAASRIRLHRDEQGRILRRPVVVLFHGLLNTPAFFQRLENETFDRGAHVFNIRLPGHFEKNARALDFINHEDWVRRAKQMVILASKLRSGGITIVGHSLGGLLASQMTETFPFYVKRLVLIAPAFQVSWQTKLLIHSTIPFGLSGWLLRKPRVGSSYRSTFAGEQTEEVIDQVLPNNHYTKELAHLRDRPVLWIDTASDIVIDVKRNETIAAVLKTPRHLLVPEARGIAHNDLGAFAHHDHDDLLAEILDFAEVAP